MGERNQKTQASVFEASVERCERRAVFQAPSLEVALKRLPIENPLPQTATDLHFYCGVAQMKPCVFSFIDDVCGDRNGHFQPEEIDRAFENPVARELLRRLWGPGLTVTGFSSWMMSASPPPPLYAYTHADQINGMRIFFERWWATNPLGNHFVNLGIPLRSSLLREAMEQNGWQPAPIGDHLTVEDRVLQAGPYDLAYPPPIIYGRFYRRSWAVEQQRWQLAREQAASNGINFEAVCLRNLCRHFCNDETPRERWMETKRILDEEVASLWERMGSLEPKSEFMCRLAWWFQSQSFGCYLPVYEIDIRQWIQSALAKILHEGRRRLFSQVSVNICDGFYGIEFSGCGYSVEWKHPVCNRWGQVVFDVEVKSANVWGRMIFQPTRHFHLDLTRILKTQDNALMILETTQKFDEKGQVFSVEHSSQTNFFAWERSFDRFDGTHWIYSRQ